MLASAGHWERRQGSCVAGDSIVRLDASAMNFWISSPINKQHFNTFNSKTTPTPSIPPTYRNDSRITTTPDKHT